MNSLDPFAFQSLPHAFNFIDLFHRTLRFLAPLVFQSFRSIHATPKFIRNLFVFFVEQIWSAIYPHLKLPPELLACVSLLKFPKQADHLITFHMHNTPDLKRTHVRKQTHQQTLIQSPPLVDRIAYCN